VISMISLNGYVEVGAPGSWVSAFAG